LRPAPCTITSARVIAGFGASKGAVAYTMDRAGPAPKVIHRSHAATGFVQDAAARG